MLRSLAIVGVLLGFSNASHAQVWIDFASLNASGSPQTFPYLRPDGSSGNVTITVLQSLGTQGTPILEQATQEGSVSPVGGIYMGIGNVNV